MFKFKRSFLFCILEIDRNLGEHYLILQASIIRKRPDNIAKRKIERSNNHISLFVGECLTSETFYLSWKIPNFQVDELYERINVCINS